MSQAYLNLITVPLLAGFVGYITNALAIKMLFRPYKPKWYTLGWQGVIPRTRKKLAISIGTVVSEKLLTHEEIEKTVLQSNFQMHIEKFLKNELYKLNTNESINSLSKKVGFNAEKQLYLIINNALKNENVKSFIDENATLLLKSIIKYISTVDKGILIDQLSKLDKIALNSNIDKKIRQSIKQTTKDILHNFIYSGASINDISNNIIKPEVVADKLTDIILELLKKVSKDPIMAKKVSDILIKYKDKNFKGNFFDQLKLTAFNIFLYNDKIEELVKQKLPELGDTAATDTAFRNYLKQIITNEINNALNTPLYKFAEKLKPDTYYQGINNITVMFVDKILNTDILKFSIKHIKNFLNNSEYNTIKEWLDSDNINIENFLPDKISLSDKLLSKNINIIIKKNIRTICRKPFISMQMDKNHTIADSIASNVSIKTVDLLIKQLPEFLKIINLNKVVEDKINSLPLDEVENILFAFMKDHFKWINRLGFIIGFIIGFIQVAVISFNS